MKRRHRQRAAQRLRRRRRRRCVDTIRERSRWRRLLADARARRIEIMDHCKKVYSPQLFRLATQLIRAEQSFAHALGRNDLAPQIRSATYGGPGVEPITISW